MNKQKKISGKKKSKAELLVTGGILAASSAIAISLFAYFRPFSGEDVLSAARNFYRYVTECIADAREHISELKKSQQPATESFLASGNGDINQDSSPSKDSFYPSENEEAVPYMDRTAQMGNIADMTSEPVFPPQEDAIYSCMLDTAMGPLLYYNQGDIRWKEYLYGGSDRISKYGCGPVCVAMIIDSFTPSNVSPVEMADWSAENGYYARQGGSYHGLIPGSLSAFGLHVESVTDRTVEHATELLLTDHILVALMGKGKLTQNGHFIIIAQICPSGNVYIADPASYEDSTKEWDLQLLMDELKGSYDSGGPLWAVSVGDGELQ